MVKLIAPLVLVAALAAPARAAEVCGNGVDDDANDLADEGCYPTLTTGQCESPLSCEDTGMVSPSTGSMRYSLPPDIAPKVPYGPGIGLRRFYLSMYAPPTGAPTYRKSMGERWGHTYMTWLDDVSNGGPTKLILHTNRGQDILLNKTSSDAAWEYFTPQPGFHFKHVRRRLTAPYDVQVKQLTGEVTVYDSTGKLIEIWDTLATPNKVLVAYDANDRLSTVTDASGKRRLLFGGYVNGRITSVAFQIYVGAAWTTYHTTTYGYTDGHPTTVTIGGALAQTNSYANGYLTAIHDAGGSQIASFAYDTTTPGKVVRVDTPRGMIGWETASSRTSCSGQTVLYFNRGNALTCSSDNDCGSGFLCGGKTGSGSTGMCFRAARCLTIASPSEDVVTSVSAIGPPGETCEGTCLDAAQYIWNTGTGVLDLKAVQDPSGNYTARLNNANGLPTVMSFADPDANVYGSYSSATRWMELAYNADFPGRVSEILRVSELAIPSWGCGSGFTWECARTAYTYNVDGLLASITHEGWTLDINNAVVPFSSTTTYTYDAKGRLTRIEGPAPENAVTIFEYWTSSNPLEDGFLRYYKREKAQGDYHVQTALAYDFWGNATSVADVDGTLSCQTFDAARGYLAQRREAMAGQSSCTPHADDLVTSWARDSALRLTQLTRPDGSCLHYEYDARGRLASTKRRDDCNPASSGDRQEYTYSDDSLLTKVETLDASGSVTRRQEMTYYDSRRLQKLLNPVDTSKWTGIIYDAFGLVSEVTGADTLSKTTYTRNADQRVTTESRYRTSSAFDSWSLLYDWDGNQKQVTDGDAKITKSVRDDRGFIVRLESPDLGGYPTVWSYDGANRLASYRESAGGSSPKTHSYSYDKLGRVTAIDYHGACSGASPVEITQSYDALPTGITCPITGGCTRIAGRLAYVKATLMCSKTLGDSSLDQETFYAYDDAGRVVREYIRDDTGRVAEQQYTWTKNGALLTTTTPSGAVLGATFGSTTSNADTDRIAALWRTSLATPIIDNVRWNPYGPLQQYNQMNTQDGVALRTRITRNLAYRISGLYVEKQTGGTPLHAVTIAEDAKGRVIQRDYFPSDPTIPGLHDSNFQYDLQDRLLCETTSPMTSCPTTVASFGQHKNSHSASPPFTAAGDWKQLLRPIPGSTCVTHNFTLAPGKHQIASVTQPEQSNGCGPIFGTTSFGYDSRGNRSYDDNTNTLLYDRRDYTYDARRNVINVRGRYYANSQWGTYDVTSAFDAQNRRVFKSFTDVRTGAQAQWFFYYDANDRLVEVRHVPDAATPSTYSVFQLFWLRDRLVLYWQTDYPAATTSKRYVGTDESGRPIDMMCWSSGNCPRVWSVRPDAWGFDTIIAGPAVFQPRLFAGQYRDSESTAVHNDGLTTHRDTIALNGYRTYDNFTGTYLQGDPLVTSTWSTYSYVDSNPIARQDEHGLAWDGSGWDPDGEVIQIEGESPVIVVEPEWEDGWGTWPSPPPGGGGGGGGGGGPEPPSPPDSPCERFEYLNCSEQAAEKKTLAYQCSTKCAKVNPDGTGHGNCTGHVDGTATGGTKDDACAAAKSNANSNAAADGCRAKHCSPCECTKTATYVARTRPI